MIKAFRNLTKIYREVGHVGYHIGLNFMFEIYSPMFLKRVTLNIMIYFRNYIFNFLESLPEFNRTYDNMDSKAFTFTNSSKHF